MSPVLLALIFIAGGIALVFAVMGFSAKDLFKDSITEEAMVALKQEELCVIEASDGIPRQITQCPYEVGDKVLIKYKQQQPSIESHALIQSDQR